MRELTTKHEIVEVQIGFYDTKDRVFYITRPYFKIIKDEFVLTFIHNRKLEQHLVLKTVTPQDLADCISTYHADKIKKDNIIKKEYESNGNNN